MFVGCSGATASPAASARPGGAERGSPVSTFPPRIAHAWTRSAANETAGAHAASALVVEKFRTETPSSANARTDPRPCERSLSLFSEPYA